MKAITGARDVIAVNSGMAAISNALMAVAGAGKTIVTSRHLFGNTFALVDKTLRRFGVDADFIDLTDLKAVEHALEKEDVACVFLEILTNPQLEVADVPSIAALAHAKNVPVLADTTAVPFTEFDGKSLGIDVEIVSSTKYISGGATSIGGLIIDYGTIPGFQEVMRREVLMNLGAYMTPHAAYMQTLGLENLNARYALQAANTLAVAKKLRELPEIKRVNYVGLEDNPYHDLFVKQFGKTAGAMLTIDLADEQACYDFLNNLKLVKRATNLFDNKTLAIHPASTIFGPFTKVQRGEMDVLDTTVRLSIGLEDVDDIVDDIKQALKS